MGTYATASLVYGYVWDPETVTLADIFGVEEDEDGETPEWESLLAERRGIADPHPPDVDWSSWYEVPEHKVAMQAYWEAKRALKDELGCDIGWHGYLVADFEAPILYVIESEIEADAGKAHELTHDELSRMASGPVGGMRRKLERFVDELGVDLSEAAGPAWFLTARYG